MTRRGRVASAVGSLVVVTAGGGVAAHEGPPYPIISNQIAGDYSVSLWTDPDTSDDGTPGGQFWVMVDPAGRDVAPVGELRTRVVIRPLDRDGPEQSGWAEAVDGDSSRQFIALLMDHEGAFAVQLEIEGAGQRAVLTSEVEATYDLRPPRALLALYVLPFLVVGVLWAKLLVRRRRARAQAAG